MISFIKKVIKKKFPVQALHYKAYKRLIKNQNSYLYSTGWMQSIKDQKPTDNKGSLIPWMNFPVVRFLEDRLKDDLNLFEFGSGYSTFFYSRKVKAVTSVENNESWFQHIRSKVPGNVVLIYKARDYDGDYCRVIGSTNDQYDVVIVDGRDRVNCIKQSISALSSRGVILLDDSNRENYQEGIEFAKEKGFRALDMEGLKATGEGVYRTTILYREGNCLGI